MKKFTVRVHYSNLELFRTRVAEINEKFSKKNLPLVTWAILVDNVEEHVYTIIAKSEFEQSNLSGIDVKFEGVVSLIDCSENDKVYTFDNPLITRLVSADCKCDKCQKKIGRAKYIVFSKTDDVQTRDDLVVLGTTCAKEYFPFDVESYFYGLELAFDELMGLYDEEMGSCSFRATTTDFDDLFYATVACTDNLKVYEKEDRRTRSLVDRWLANEKVSRYSSVTYRDEYPIPSNAYTLAEIKEWISESFNKGNDEIRNDFEMNARTTFYKTLDDGTRELRDRIPNKFLGIAIYGFISAKKNHERLVEKKIAEEKRAIENAKVEYYGNVGDKFELTLTFDKTFGFEGAYGFTYIHLFHDDENHVFAWSSSNGNYKVEYAKNVTWGGIEYVEYEAGHKYLIKGSIKDHREYRNVKQTVITRCKVLDDFIERKVEVKENLKGATVATVVDYVDPFDTLMEAMESIEQSA